MWLLQRENPFSCGAAVCHCSYMLTSSSKNCSRSHLLGLKHILFFCLSFYTIVQKIISIITLLFQQHLYRNRFCPKLYCQEMEAAWKYDGLSMQEKPWLHNPINMAIIHCTSGYQAFPNDNYYVPLTYLFILGSVILGTESFHCILQPHPPPLVLTDRQPVRVARGMKPVTS